MYSCFMNWFLLLYAFIGGLVGLVAIMPTPAASTEPTDEERGIIAPYLTLAVAICWPLMVCALIHLVMSKRGR